MFNIDNDNKILISRGDSGKAPLFLNRGTDLYPERYTLKDNDIIYLAIMQPNEYFETATVKQTYTNKDNNKNGDVEIKLSPKDTECLIPGKYFYQIKIKIMNEDGTFDVNTVIEKTEFIILE